MSQPLISRSPDLRRLRDEGYHVVIIGAYLVVRDIPHVNDQRQVKLGTLVSDLTLAGEITTRPSTHVVYFAGDYPCRPDGTRIAQIEHGVDTRQIDPDLTVRFTFSNKPPEGYTDYYHKMTTYIAIISGPAQALDSNASPKTFPPIEETEPDSPFRYLDTASSRADINMATRKLKLNKVAIIGLGGTGSYVLDLVAKTPVREIHLFDKDTFSQHNAFRTPGAASLEELQAKPTKVAYLKERYSPMHTGIVAHEMAIDGTNVDLLLGMDFVFLCLDQGGPKQHIVEALEKNNTSFVDVGMGLNLVDDGLIGVLRVTTSTRSKRDHVRATGRIAFGDGGPDEYAKNIQVADLNALNATMAVIKWKKLLGFYHDQEHEHHMTYTIDTNMLLNDDRA